MFIRQHKKEHELQRSETKSMIFIVASLVLANIFLIFGFASVANAQVISTAYPAFDLAKMLAAPDLVSSPSNFWILGVMAIGFVVMAASSLLFWRNFATNVDKATRPRM